MAGLVWYRKRGNRVSVTLDDDSGRMEAACSAKRPRSSSTLVKDEILVVSGGLRYDDFIGSWTLNAKSIVHVDKVIESRANGMLLLAPNGGGEQLIARLHDVLLPYRQETATWLRSTTAMMPRLPEPGAGLVGAPEPRAARQAGGTLGLR